jgi:hypothetical protein
MQVLLGLLDTSDFMPHGGRINAAQRSLGPHPRPAPSIATSGFLTTVALACFAWLMPMGGIPTALNFPRNSVAIGTSPLLFHNASRDTAIHFTPGDGFMQREPLLAIANGKVIG